jgi:hypothetical protein
METVRYREVLIEPVEKAIEPTPLFDVDPGFVA